MIRFLTLAALLSLPGCMSPSSGGFAPPANRGQYVRPDYLNPALQPRLPPADECRSQLYLGLIGRHEGAIYLAGLPGRKRILKPSTPEGFGYSNSDDFYVPTPLVEVRDFIPDQALYAPSIRTVADITQLGPAQNDRLTIELDANGIVQQVRCE